MFAFKLPSAANLIMNTNTDFDKINSKHPTPILAVCQISVIFAPCLCVLRQNEV